MPIARWNLEPLSRETAIMGPASSLLSDELWGPTSPALPRWSPSPKGGQPRLDDRKALTGILFVLKTGIPWEDLLPVRWGAAAG